MDYIIHIYRKSSVKCWNLCENSFNNLNKFRVGVEWTVNVYKERSWWMCKCKQNVQVMFLLFYIFRWLLRRWCYINDEWGSFLWMVSETNHVCALLKDAVKTINLQENIDRDSQTVLFPQTIKIIYFDT